MSDQLSKELEIMKRKEAEIQDMKSLVVSMASRFNQYQDRMLEIGDEVDVVDYTLSNILKLTRFHMSQMQHLAPKQLQSYRSKELEQNAM